MVVKQYDFTNGQSLMAKLDMTVLDPNVLSRCTYYPLESFVVICFIKHERRKTMSQKYPLEHYDTIVAELTYVVINSVMRPSYTYRLTNVELNEKTMECKEELWQHLKEALDILGLKLLDFNFG